ncbi:hypothetical protein QF036_002554 [Arthrobacter globiformis]|nr:hypothetical protein [Arthrobacter globiformis]
MASIGCVAAKSTATCLEWTTVYLVGPSTQEWIQVFPPGSDSLAEPSRVSLGVPLWTPTLSILSVNACPSKKRTPARRSGTSHPV